MSLLTVLLTASITGIGLGTGFNVASAVASLTWQPASGIVSEQYNWYVRSLFLACQEQDPCVRRANWNRVVAQLCCEQFLPLDLRLWLLGWIY